MTTIETYQAPDSVAGLQRLGTGAALVGAVLAVIGFVMSGSDRFFEAYLAAFLYPVGLALGSLALLMVHHLSGGAWGVVIRRPLEAATRTLPIMGLLFVPIIFGMGHLYHWTHADAVANDPVIRDKAAYLNQPFFFARQLIYFAVWSAMGYFITTWSAEHDRTGDPALLRKLSRLSGAGLVVYSLTITFATVDWVMSVNPHWFSTMWGPMFMINHALSALSLAIVVLVMLAQYPPLNRIITAAHLHDLGKLLFAFLMLWAYLNFSEFLIIWSANVGEEIPHFIVRMNGGYEWVGVVLILLHWAVPYALLLARDVKRDMTRIRAIALWLLAMKVVDYYWLVIPEFHDSLTVTLLDVGLPIALGGIFLALFAMFLRARPLLPVNDPGLEKALHHHVH
jgi:hypothetical protein